MEHLLTDIKDQLEQLTGHPHLALIPRGDAAIKAVLQPFDSVLIPEEGGWLSYRKYPKDYAEVKCQDSKIDLADLEKKILTNRFTALLYQNPGGYFAEQPIKEIYLLCSKYNCKVILDVSGAIGTSLCNGKYADFMVGSFGQWKLVDAGVGGFVSAKEKQWFDQLKLNEFDDLLALKKISKKLLSLNTRVNFLLEKRRRILADLAAFNLLCPEDIGFVIVVECLNNKEKESIINYCYKNSLEWTECPRYIRVSKKAISIEVKRLQHVSSQ